MARDIEHTQNSGGSPHGLVGFEDDPHRAALEDNPDHIAVSSKSWIAIFVRNPRG